jgi:hypothetical protein
VAIKSRPGSVTEAYRIINNTQPGDYGQAQSFLKGMSSLERKARHREEKRSEVKPRKRKYTMGSKPYPYRSRRYA